MAHKEPQDDRDVEGLLDRMDSLERERKKRRGREAADGDGEGDDGKGAKRPRPGGLDLDSVWP